jgi:hypothetical protein
MLSYRAESLGNRKDVPSPVRFSSVRRHAMVCNSLQLAATPVRGSRHVKN